MPKEQEKIDINEAKLVLQDIISNIDACVLRVIHGKIVTKGSNAGRILTKSDSYVHLNKMRIMTQGDLELNLATLQDAVNYYGLKDFRYVVSVNSVYRNKGLILFFDVPAHSDTIVLETKFDWAKHIPGGFGAIESK